MKKHGILNRDLSRAIATMGHGDLLVIGDAGLPIPDDHRCIDLSVTAGVPRFLDVLRAVLAELRVESAVVAEEMATRSPDLHRALREALGDVPVDAIPHEAFKGTFDRVKVFVRSGETTPYANVMLRSGVTF